MRISLPLFAVAVFAAAVVPDAAAQSAVSERLADVSDERIENLHSVADGRFSDARKADAFYSLGEIYVGRSRTQEALNYYLASYNHSRSRKRKLRALERLSEMYYAQGSLGKAIEFTKDAALLAPRDNGIAAKLAGYYARADLRVQAVEEYKKILLRNPDDVEVLAATAEILESLGLYADAIEHYKKAIVRGASGDVTLRVAHCYEMFSERSIAEALLKEYLAVRPDYGGFIQLGKLYYSLRDYARAAEAFSSAVKINPRGREALLLSGVAYYKSSRPREAAEMFKILLKENPESAAARFFMGLVMDSSGAPSEAASAEYSAAIRLSPEGSLPAAVAREMNKSSRAILKNRPQ